MTGKSVTFPNEHINGDNRQFNAYYRNNGIDLSFSGCEATGRLTVEYRDRDRHKPQLGKALDAIHALRLQGMSIPEAHEKRGTEIFGDAVAIEIRCEPHQFNAPLNAIHNALSGNGFYDVKPSLRFEAVEEIKRTTHNHPDAPIRSRSLQPGKAR